jgi:hypothetical protein
MPAVLKAPQYRASDNGARGLPPQKPRVTLSQEQSADQPWPTRVLPYFAEG